MIQTSYDIEKPFSITKMPKNQPNQTIVDHNTA